MLNSHFGPKLSKSTKTSLKDSIKKNSLKDDDVMYNEHATKSKAIYKKQGIKLISLLGSSIL